MKFFSLNISYFLPKWLTIKNLAMSWDAYKGVFLYLDIFMDKTLVAKGTMPKKNSNRHRFDGLSIITIQRPIGRNHSFLCNGCIAYF